MSANEPAEMTAAAPGAASQGPVDAEAAAGEHLFMRQSPKTPSRKTPALAEDRRRSLAAFRLYEVPGYLIRRMQQRAVEIFDEEVGKLGVTPQQFAVLRAVEADPGLSQIDVVEATGIDRSTLTELVGRMSDRRLIRMERSGDDRRSNSLFLTKEGEALLLEALPRVIAAQARILSPIPAGRRSALLRQLALLADLPGELGGADRGADQKRPRRPTAPARTRRANAT